MKRKLHHPFHFLALEWLREKMGVNTRTIVGDDSRTQARVTGFVLPRDYHSVIGFLAIMLLVCAATVAIASARHEVGDRLAYALQVGAIAATAIGVVLLVVDNWREYHRARRVEVIVCAGADREPVDPAQLARWHADASAQLWVVSERGFTRETLALARTHEVRCFAVRKHWIEECWSRVMPALDADADDPRGSHHAMTDPRQ
jgi:hypothetical protein